MAKPDVLVKGRFQVNMNLKGQVKAAQRGATAGMKKEAARLQKLIRAKAKVYQGKPYVDKWGSHGGAMKRNTEVRAVGGKRPRMEVRSTDYALFIDQGTRTIEPDFFITGTIRDERRRTISNIAAATRKKIAADAKKQKAKRAAAKRGRRR